MNRSKKTDKKVAKAIKKVHRKKATEDDVVFLIRFCNDKYQLEHSMKKTVEMEIGEIDNEPGNIIQGRYHSFLNKFIINRKLLLIICNGGFSGFFEAANIVGHELSHSNQDEKKSFVPTDFKEIDKFIGIKSILDSDDADFYYEYIRYGEYYSNFNERDARDGGEQFSRDIYSYLMSNKYIGKKIKKDIGSSFSSYESEEKKCDDNGVKYVGYYKRHVERLLKWSFLDIGLREISLEKENDDLAVNGIVSFVGLLSRNMNPKDVCKGYCNLVTSGLNCFGTRYALALYINSDSFPRNYRESVQDYLYNYFISAQDVSLSSYDSELSLLLDSDLIKGIYKDLLTKDVMKTKNGLFREFLSENKDGPQMIGESIVDAFKEGSINIKSADDLAFISRQADVIVEHFGGKISSNLKLELMNVVSSLSGGKETTFGKERI
jgi:hypothetical protein